MWIENENNNNNSNNEEEISWCYSDVFIVNIEQIHHSIQYINPFHATDLFLYPLKRSVAWNELIQSIYNLKQMWCFAGFGTICPIWKTWKTHGGVLIFVKSKAKICNFTKINTPPWVFFTFFKLEKLYQMVQRTTNMC